MAHISFDVHQRFDQKAQVVWDELVDWKSHENWIPLTRVQVGDGEMTAAGHEFTAWTGFGPLSLEDRMRVVACDWDPESASGNCVVDKLGPVLRGSARFVVEPGGDGGGSQLVWTEDVSVRFVPQFLAPVAAKVGAWVFRRGMRSLAKNLAAR